MAKAIGKTLTSNLKELVSMDTLKDGAILASGSVATPILSGIIQNAVNKAKPGMIAAGKPMSKILDLLSAAGIATLAAWATKSANVARLMMLGGMSGVMSDIASEAILPMIGLRDYIDPRQMNDYLTMAPGGVSDFLTMPPGMSDFLTEQQMGVSGLNDWASVEQVVNAGPSYDAGETF
jgi:hypothetical protein